MQKVMFLTGPHASGKTFTTKQFIEKNAGIEMIDTGPIMRNLHKEHSPNTSLGEWIGALEKEYGERITSDLISKEIKSIIDKSENSNFIIIGFRSLDGILYTVKQLGIVDYNILYVDADRRILYSNFISRENQNITMEEFDKYIDDEDKLGLDKLRELAKSSDTMVDYFYKEANDDKLEYKLEDYFGFDKNRESQKMKEIVKCQKNTFGQ